MSINSHIKTIQQKIAITEQRYDRTPNSVQLIAVSKGHSVEEILQAIAAGQQAFAENYLQEGLEKIKALQDLALIWHFIGPIQSNKAKLIAQNFNWVHTIDRPAIATLLNQYRPQHLPPLNVCIQVNVSQEPSKSGITIAELPALATHISELPKLKLRGLMTIPQPTTTFAEQRKPFHALHLALKALNTRGWLLDTLSMGMSNDYEAAIAEGATFIRLGTALFGPRRS